MLRNTSYNFRKKTDEEANQTEENYWDKNKPTYILHLQFGDQNAFQDHKYYRTDTMAVIVSSSFVKDPGDRTTQNFSWRATLVSIESSEDDTIYARHLCVAMLVQAITNDDDFKVNIKEQNTAFGPAIRSVDPSSRLLRGIRTANEQAWCIG